MATKAIKAPSRRRKVESEQPQHIHHWVVESPNGPFSIGTCTCGETKEFRNSSEDSIWDRVEGRSRWNDMGISRRRRAGDGSDN